MDRGRWPLRPKGLTHDSAAGWLYPRREGLNATSGLGLNGVGKPRDVRDVARHEYPRAIEFVDNLPTTTSGKIMRGELRGRRREQLPRTPGHRLGRRHCVLTPSTSFAYPQVVSRTFASFRVSNLTFTQLTSTFVAGSIPGSSTREGPQRCGPFVCRPSAAPPSFTTATHPTRPARQSEHCWPSSRPGTR
jgi:hypothetical protein